VSFLRVEPDPAAAVAQLSAWLDGTADVRLVVETSGSSGAPKRVVLSQAAIRASVAASAARLGGSGRWALVLPPSYVAGVQVICRSLVAGVEPVQSWDEDFEFISLVPTQLRRALADPAVTDRLASAHTVLLGGGPIDPGLRAEASTRGIRVVATYGSAETAGGCVYDGLPLDGVAVALATDGRIRIGGPTLFDGYLGDQALTDEVLVDGWFLTSDAGELDEDGRLSVLGRIDDMVISGGVKVPVTAVAARLRAHPDAGDVEVLGLPDPEWGQEVVAFVTGSLDLEAARDWVAAEQTRTWAPRRLVRLDAIPLLPNGKVDRQRLEGQA
jgi:O-succinylbenzoic acid--CoA ligase